MKVAMLGWEFPPFIAGGLGIHCLELTRALSRAGVAIDFYMPHIATMQGGARVAPHHHHLDIHEVEADPHLTPYAEPRAHYKANFNDAVALYNERLVQAFDSPDADVLHCHDWITVPAALEIKRRTGLPLVFTVHSTEHDRSGGLGPQSWIEDIERRGVQGADRVIAVSRYTKRLVEMLYGVEPSRVVPVHNGVDLERFDATRIERYDDSPPSVLFLSRLVRQKGPLFFLRTAARVLQQRPDARFVVAGEGHMLGECIEHASDAGILDRVRFTGFVPDEALPEFYTQHTAYVLPSISEPFGISVLEAMGAGLPTVVTKTTGVGEAVSHVLRTDYWDTDEMADMLLRLLGSASLREELGRNGAREAHRFTWAATCQRTIDVYRSASPHTRKTMEIAA